MTKDIQKAKSEGELLSLLRNKYPLPEWVLIEGVRESTGYSSHRTADAIAVGCWPSRGFEVQGFEIKSSRVDWKREKNDPNKASIQRYCHRWWLVIGASNIAQECEVPLNWGLMASHGEGLRIIKSAPLLEPIAPDMGFIASILRNVMESHKNLVPREEFDQAIAKKKKQWELDRKYDIQDLKKLKESVDKFQKVSGIYIDEWNNGDIGHIVKMMRQNMLNYTIQGQIQSADTAIRIIQESADKLKELLKELGDL